MAYLVHNIHSYIEDNNMRVLVIKANISKYYIYQKIYLGHGFFSTDQASTKILYRKQFLQN